MDHRRISPKDVCWQNFCENVRWIRRRDKLSKRALAEIMGISVQCLTRLEAGELPRRFGAGALLRHAEYVRRSPSELLLPPE